MKSESPKSRERGDRSGDDSSKACSKFRVFNWPLRRVCVLGISKQTHCKVKGEEIIKSCLPLLAVLLLARRRRQRLRQSLIFFEGFAIEQLTDGDVGELRHEVVSFRRAHEHREDVAVFASRHCDAFRNEHGAVLLHARHICPPATETEIEVDATTWNGEWKLCA